MTKIWTLAIDGNKASAQQVQALASALAAETGGNTADITAYVPKAPAEALKLPNNILVTWTSPASVEQLKELGLDTPNWPDYVIACRPEVAALALGIKQASGGKTKIIHIQSPLDPMGYYTFNISDFDLIIRQPQEKIRGTNVISSKMALHGFTPQLMSSFNAAAAPKIRGAAQPVIGVLIGGSDENLTLTPDDMKKFGEDLKTLKAGSIFVLTSRRTGEENIKTLKETVADSSSIFIDDPRLSYGEILAVSQKIIVTGESLSMVTEAAASGKPVSLYMFDGKLNAHPLHPIFSVVEQEGKIAFYPTFPQNITGAFDEAPELANQVLQILQKPAIPAGQKPPSLS